MHQQAISQQVNQQEDLFLQGVARLVSIESTLGPALPGMPFGAGPAAALEELLAIAGQWGLQGENLEGYVGAVDLNDQETALHILGHLDVVDAGEGWTVTQAFQPKVVEGLLYGRGTSDDKGPLVAALLAMKVVKDLGIPLKKNVRLIAGTDEETGFRDIKWYYANHPYAPHTLSPDADFPIINIEKGHYQPSFHARWPQESALPRVTSFTGGSRLNMVPPIAQAQVLGLSLAEVEAAAAAAKFEDAISVTCTQEGQAVVLQCAGQNAHASTPDQGHNAQTALVALLARLPLADCPSTRAIRSLAVLFPHGDHAGRALGVAQRDQLSGDLTLAFTMLTLTDTGCEGRFDSRTPLCGSAETICHPAQQAMAAAGFTLTGELEPPHHVPADDPFLQVLARAYETYTGQKSQCLAIGGGTYVHDIPGGVAFGPCMPGFSSNLHGPDERIPVADLLTTAKIYAQVILDLCS